MRACRTAHRASSDEGARAGGKCMWDVIPRTEREPPKSVVRHDDDVHRRVGDGRGMGTGGGGRPAGLRNSEEDSPPLPDKFGAVGTSAAPRLPEIVDGEAVCRRR